MTEEVERLGLPVASGRSGGRSVPAELDKPRLVGVQVQTERREPLAKLGKEPLCIIVVLEPGYKVVGEAHDDQVTACVAASPLPGPPVEDVVEVNVGQQRRG